MTSHWPMFSSFLESNREASFSLVLLEWISWMSGWNYSAILPCRLYLSVPKTPILFSKLISSRVSESLRVSQEDSWGVNARMKTREKRIYQEEKQEKNLVVRKSLRRRTSLWTEIRKITPPVLGSFCCCLCNRSTRADEVLLLLKSQYKKN